MVPKNRPFKKGDKVKVQKSHNSVWASKTMTVVAVYEYDDRISVHAEHSMLGIGGFDSKYLYRTRSK